MLLTVPMWWAPMQVNSLYTDPLQQTIKMRNNMDCLQDIDISIYLDNLFNRRTVQRISVNIFQCFTISKSGC